MAESLWYLGLIQKCKMGPLLLDSNIKIPSQDTSRDVE